MSVRDRDNTLTDGPVIDVQPATSGRASLVSHSLRQAAREARTPRVRWMPLRHVRMPMWRSFAFWLVASFIAVVVLPVFASGVYLALFASDQYASEVRFAVRGGERTPLDALSGVLGAAGSEYFQDALIVTTYLRGRQAVEDISKAVDLRRVFSRPEADILSRFNPSDSAEELVWYWRWRTDISIDSLSGVITVVVRAFTPQDSLDIANQVIAVSEKLVNDLSDRARRDALRQAQSELARAEATLQEKIRGMRDLRNSEGVLDADKTAEAMVKMLAEMRLQKLQLEQEYAVQMRTVAPQTPHLRVLAARIASMKEQIEKLEGQMTRSGVQNAPALADAIGQFDRQKLERDIAQKQYVAAATAFERARMQLETQQLYLATFLKPVLAQEALYPKRWWIWSIIMLGALALWGAGVGIAVLVRNYGMV
ncbi:MAG: hypothetical protein KIT82_00325 [Bradyrhizobium sp.]|nr:hypothetical protein [Bradyrhizobium sp.]